MKCPFCGYENTKVVDSRDTEDLTVTRRRRECERCNERFTTYERIELNINVRKKDNTIQAWNRDKIITGVMKACEKREIQRSDIEKMVDTIENEIKKSGKREISTVEIGEMIMDLLKDVDEVAYIRFASVYKEFKDISGFEKELNKIKTEKG